MTTEVKTFLGFGNVDKGFIQDNWTLTEPLKDLFETDETFQAKKNEQDDKDMIMLPEDSNPNSLDHGFDDERTFEIDDEQSDPIKSLSVHGLKTLCNHFSKVTAAPSVNDVITVNVMNTNPQKWIMMAQDTDITDNDAENKLLGRRDGLKDWLVWILRAPNKNTASTDHNTPQYSKTIQILNGKQARQSLFLSKQPDRYLAESTDNQNKIFLPGKTIIKTVDEKVYRSIKKEGYRGIPVWNIFDAPTRGMLLPWNLRMSWRKDLGIHLGLLLMDLSRPLNSGMVVEDHGSTEGVTLKILETYTNGTTTILLSTLNKQHESPDKSISDRKTHSVLHKSEQLLPFKLTTNTTKPS